MRVGSLIFVVVLLIWATYLSLYVARRREQMSTARSVDRFSAHMRVLQRRHVKTAAEAEAEEAPSSGNTRSSILSAGALDETDRLQELRRTASGAASRAERGVQVAREYLGVVHSNRVFAAWGGLTGLLDGLNPRRLRAYALLTFAVAGALSLLLAATGRIGWLLPTLSASGLFALLAWLRADRRTVAAAWERRATADRAATERDQAQAERLAAAEAEELARRAAEARPAAGPLPVAQENAPALPHRSYDFFDRAAFDEDQSGSATRGGTMPVAAGGAVAGAASGSSTDETSRAGRVRETDPVAAEKRWQPVPVPPPTYTLKARADHPMPPALATPVEPEPIDVVDEFEDALWRQDAVGS